jgi:hypothetical protein
MRTKDTILLENAYNQVTQGANTRVPKDPTERQNYLNDLIAGFTSNPNKGTALADINTAYLGKVATLSNDSEEPVTGKVEKIFYGPSDSNLKFVVAGKTLDVSQERWSVQLNDLGGSSSGAPVTKWTGGSALRPPGMRF